MDRRQRMLQILGVVTDGKKLKEDTKNMITVEEDAILQLAEMLATQEQAIMQLAQIIGGV